MIALTAALLLAVLAALNRRIAGSWLYPPAFFTAYWSVLLIALYASGDMFYPISLATVVLLFVGKLAFSLGGLVVLITLSRSSWSLLPDPDPRRKLAVRVFLDCGILLLLAALPFYWALVQNASKKSGMIDFWVGVRCQASEVTDGKEFGAFDYIMAFSNVLTLIALNEFDGKRQRWRPAALILVSLTYQLLSMSRLGSLRLILGLLGILWIRSGRINARYALLGGVGMLALFISVGVVLGKGGSTSFSLSENVAQLYEELQLYICGGIVAFDRYVMGMVPVDTGLTFRFFAVLANVFGAKVHVAPILQPYTDTPLPTNVYTIYFPFYSDFGILGVIGIMLTLGGVATLVYLAAQRGHPPSVILFGLLLSGLIITNFTDPFLTALSTWIQSAIISMAVYSVPLIIYPRKKTWSLMVDSDCLTSPGKSFFSGHRHRVENKQAATGIG